MKKNILDLTPEELAGEIKNMGEKPYRARQVFSAIAKKHIDDFYKITSIPEKLRGRLDKKFNISGLTYAGNLVSRKDGTGKYLWQLGDGLYIESVLIKKSRRLTLCISTQAGCRIGCPFCASGTDGFKRDLDTAEIAGQYVETQKRQQTRITNIVFMGMGEPLDNFDNLYKAIKIINDPDGPGLGARRITVSTCGLVPGMKKLAGTGLQTELSVSLHSTYDARRNELVPVNRKYPLKELYKACEEYKEKTGRVITLEYTVIRGKNDSDDEAVRLGKVSKKLGAKINLIKCSPTGRNGKDRGHADRAGINRFKKVIKRNGGKVTVRDSAGEDIAAACGQLAIRKGTDDRHEG